MRSLRFRIALTYAALIAVAMAGLGLALMRAEEGRFRRRLDERLLSEARLVAAAAVPAMPGGIAVADPLAKRLGADGGVRVTLIDATGTVLGDSENDARRLDNHSSRPEVREALEPDGPGVGRASRRSDTENRDFTYLAVPIRDDGRALGVARVSTPSSAVNSDLRRIALSVGVSATAAALGAAILAAFIARAITRPLDRLRRAARALAEGGFDRPAPAILDRRHGGGVEVAELAGAFSEMAARLHETVDRLSQERSRLEALLASSADALIALDAAGVVRYANPAATARLGRLEDRPLVEGARNHELNDLVRDALGGGRRAAAQLSLDGVDTWVQATASPIAGGGGWAALVILHDITEVRRAESTRRDFVANVSHELRTPLAGIKAVVETLRDGAMHDTAAAEEFLGRVDTEVDRLVQLVEELLQLSRIESGAEMVMEPVRPEEILGLCVDRFTHMAERAGVQLTLDLPPSLPVIRADAARLGQAAGNLIHNAIKFTPAGGAVAVSAVRAGSALHIRVQDTGEGIDPADLPRIFERFYIADRARTGRGTGLGLAIVKHVVRAHGGTVDARSTPGRGSTFTLTLPIGEETS
jgi:two-component system, OmpR family, phosphate regulon sensor histidine kinase PhoR